MFSNVSKLIAALAMCWHAQDQRICGICRQGMLRLLHQGF